jgi:flagellar assembly protein FliH
MNISEFQRQEAPGQAAESAFRPVWEAAQEPFRTLDPASRAAASQAEQSAQDGKSREEELQEIYQKGFADGQAAMSEANADLLAASEKLENAATSLKAQPGDAVAETLLLTVRRLIEETAGFSAPDAQMLEDNCRALAAIAAKECANAALHIHPEDRAMLGDAQIGVALHADASLMRGTLSLAHDDGWIEQGTKSMLDELDAMIETLREAR